jgi:hypothetical protein
MSIDSLNTGLRSSGYLRQKQGCVAILSNIFRSSRLFGQGVAVAVVILIAVVLVIATVLVMAAVLVMVMPGDSVGQDVQTQSGGNH